MREKERLRTTRGTNEGAALRVKQFSRSTGTKSLKHANVIASEKAAAAERKQSMALGKDTAGCVRVVSRGRRLSALEKY